MRQLAAIFIFSLMLAGILYAEDAENVFKNVTVGFEVTKPESWHFLTVDQDLENIKNMKLGDDEFHKLMIKYATAPLVIMTKYPEPYGDLNPSFKANIKPYGDLKGKDPKEVLTLLTNQIRNVFKDYVVVQPPSDAEVAGIKSGYMRVNYSLQAKDGTAFPITFEFWIVPRGDYFFMIGGGTRQDEKTGSRTEISEIIKTIKIKK